MCAHKLPRRDNRKKRLWCLVPFSALTPCPSNEKRHAQGCAPPDPGCLVSSGGEPVNSDRARRGHAQTMKEIDAQTKSHKDRTSNTPCWTIADAEMDLLRSQSWWNKKQLGKPADALGEKKRRGKGWSSQEDDLTAHSYKCFKNSARSWTWTRALRYCS